MTVRPTPEQLAALLAERLSAADAKALQTHVEKCEHCQRALAELSAKTLDHMRVAFEQVVGEAWRGVVHPAQAPFAFQKKAEDR